MVNLDGTQSDVKVYTVNGAAPGSASSLPDWLTRRRALANAGKGRFSKEQVEGAIDLIQDFEFPEASNRIRSTRDGRHVYATGTYKPRMRCFDLDQLTVKFERHTNAENVDFIILSDDWTKTLHLQDNRTLEFHNQAGLYYVTRIPRLGRCLTYHYPSCDAMIGGVGNEIYRLNLDQGRFLNSLQLSSDVEGVNAIDINPAHQLLSFGTENVGDGTVEFWDPRSRSRVGTLKMPRSQILPMGVSAESDFSKSAVIEVTALSSRSDGLSLAVGTSTGHTLLYDLRSPKHYAIKDQGYGLPMKNVIWVEGGSKIAGDGMVISADRKVIKIWDRNTPTVNFASITPATDINHVHHIPASGLIMLANEGPRMTSYYVPQLGPAPKWCSFLDNITEEMEEQATRSIYEDFKFVERTELGKLGLDHLIGSKVLKPYMHGYFLPLKLYDAARVVANPFAYEEHRERLIKEKVEKLAESRIRSKPVILPKVNRQLAAKLQKAYEKRTSLVEKKRAEEEEEQKAKEAAGEDEDTEKKESASQKRKKRKERQELEMAEGGVLFDPRFKEMFENPEFEMDPESREYMLSSAGVASSSSKKSKKRRLTAVEQEMEESDVSSSSDGLGMSSSSSSSEEDSDESSDVELVDMQRFKKRAERRQKEREQKKQDDKLARKLETFPEFKRVLSQQPKLRTVAVKEGFDKDNRNASFGERKAAGGSKASSSSLSEDRSADAFAKGLVISWTPGKDDGKADGDRDRDRGKPDKTKRRKGIQEFGAGLEKGEEDNEDLSGTQRNGRTQKRRDVRTASKNAFRILTRQGK
ncbi:hypothetical protein FRB99_008840 [Tulasnella sp. 403]|nr:hypothetical protein FRB99_008840 [Tulasnella sp. 403]